MGFINKLFSKKKTKDEITEEERAKLESLLNEKKLVEEEIDDEYVDDISFPEVPVKQSEEKTIVQTNIKNTELKSENTKAEVKEEKKEEEKKSVKVQSNLSLEEEEEFLLHKFVSKLSLNQIEKIKELILEKELELSKKQQETISLDSMKKKEPKIKLKEVSQELPEIRNEPKKKYNEFVMYDTSEYGINALDNINVTKNASFNPYKDLPVQKLKEKEEVLVIDEEDEEKSSLEKNAIIINKLRDIFTDDNLFFKESKKISYEILKGKEVTCVGIRKKSAYFTEESISEQNSTFITEIKKFDELKNCKVIRSEDGIKDLVWNKEHPVLICFRTVNLLPNQDFFSFPEDK